MALYLSLVLGAELSAVDAEVDTNRTALAIIWGTAVGLALAHVFVFGLLTRFLSGRRLQPDSIRSMLAQFGSAVALAALISIPFLMFGVSRGFEVSLWLIGGFIGFTVYALARAHGTSRIMSVIDGAVMVVLGLVVIAAKAALSAH